MNSSVTIRLPGFAIVAKGEQESSAVAASKVPDIPISDEALMAQICDGSREALAILFRRYARLVRTVAVRILRDDSEADDLLQDIFLFIHHHCSVFDSSKACLRSWIVQMSYQRAFDRRRYLNARHFYTRLDLDGIADLQQSGSQSQDEDGWFAALVGKATVAGLLDILTEDQRNTLSLHFFEGYTFAEIAVKLDQSLANIRNHYYRGLDKLRKQVFPAKLPRSNEYAKK